MFFDPCQYEEAIRTVQAGLRIISAAYSPLMMDFTAYRTPFSLLTPQQMLADAASTLAFIRARREQIALFICGCFGLCHGSRVAHHPEAFGLKHIWHLQGDELQTGLFSDERQPFKTDDERQRLDREIDALSQGWWLHDYPWAGALSTVHTLLWYARCETDVFKRLTGAQRRLPQPKKPSQHASRFDIDRIIRNVRCHEAEIWQTLIYDQKAVSPELYQKYCRQYPSEHLQRTRTTRLRPRLPARKRRCSG